MTQMTGFDAGWLLSFRREEANGDLSAADAPVEFSCEDGYGDIRATLPNGLEGGTYTFTVEGISDADYKSLSLADHRPLRVSLYLYWRDAIDPASSFLSNVAAYGANLLGAGGSHPSRADALPSGALVAVLRATAVTRKAGARRYELQVTARERIYDLVAGTVVGRSDLPDTYQALVNRLLSQASLQSGDGYRYHAPTHAPNEIPSMNAGDTVLSALNLAGSKLEEADQKYGRKIFLIRNGVLHVGPRDIPVEGSAITLDESGGLLEITTTGQVVTDPNFSRLDHPGENPKTRRQFRLVCKGRPDIKPGDVVTFKPPDEDKADTGPLGGIGGIIGAVASVVGAAVPDTSTPVRMYVESVDHKLSRTDAFVTTITGVELNLKSDWDEHTVYRPGTPRRNGASTSANMDATVVEAARRAIDRAIGVRRFSDVGEIRAEQLANASRPGQTLTTGEGLAVPSGSSDAGARQAARLDVARPSPAPTNSVPYLTPFAWGKCGLILPHYPGTRVMLDHRNGQADDPVVVGALWKSGEAPQHGQAGDWWLILPVDAPTRALDADTSEAPPAFNGKATNDLIDGAGARVVEAKTFVVRAGDLKAAGDRPVAIPSGTALQLVHTAGQTSTSISLKTDGSLEIKTSKGISLDAGDDISIKSAKNVNIEAAAVNVKVSSAMDVSQR